MREKAILEELMRRLPEVLPEGRFEAMALEGAGVDATIDLRLAGRRIPLALELKARPTLAVLRDTAVRLRAGAGKSHYPMIVAPHLNPAMRALCRKEGVGYLDLSGNLRIEWGSVLIQKDVPKNLYPHGARERSPFADRASRVLRFLATGNGVLGVRALAAEVGLEAGYVSRVLHAAEAAGYVALDAQGRARARNREEMLGDWSSFYSWRRNRAQGYHHLASPTSSLKKAVAKHLEGGKPGTYALTLHAGNNRVDPFVEYGVVHLYVPEGSPLPKKLETTLKLRPVPVEGANLVVATPYYRDSAFYGVRSVRGLQVVSDLQLYLDLKRFPVRGEEAAEQILDRRLRPGWERTE